MLPVPGTKPKIPFNSTTCAILSQFPLQFRKDRTVYLYYFRFSIPLFSTIKNISVILYHSKQGRTSHWPLQLPLFYPIFLYNYRLTTEIIPSLSSQNIYIPFFSTTSTTCSGCLPFISIITAFLSHFSLQLKVTQSFSTVQSKAERPIYLYNYVFSILFFSTINNHSNHPYLAE